VALENGARWDELQTRRLCLVRRLATLLSAANRRRAAKLMVKAALPEKAGELGNGARVIIYD